MLGVSRARARILNVSDSNYADRKEAVYVKQAEKVTRIVRDLNAFFDVRCERKVAGEIWKSVFFS